MEERVTCPKCYGAGDDRFQVGWNGEWLACDECDGDGRVEYDATPRAGSGR